MSAKTFFLFLLPILTFACLPNQRSHYKNDPCSTCQIPEVMSESACSPQYSPNAPVMTKVVDGDLCLLKVTGCSSYYYNTTGSPCVQDSLRWGKMVCNFEGQFVYEFYGDVIYGIKCFT